MTIHTAHPFDDPPQARDPVRRLRGRLISGVTLWTAGADQTRAGLTVSSLMVAPGEPARVLALLGPDADLTAELTRTGRAVVQVLGWTHRGLADMFAGLAPAPGGPFAFGDFEATHWGPALRDSIGWLGVRLDDERRVGWSTEVNCVVETVVLGEDEAPLVHRRGRWVRP